MDRINWNNVTATSLDSAVRLVADAYANKQKALGDLIGIGSEFAKNVQQANHDEIKNYIDSLSRDELKNKETINSKVNELGGDWFGYDKGVVGTYLDSRVPIMNTRTVDDITTQNKIDNAIANQYASTQMLYDLLGKKAENENDKILIGQARVSATNDLGIHKPYQLGMGMALHSDNQNKQVKIDEEVKKRNHQELIKKGSNMFLALGLNNPLPQNAPDIDKVNRERNLNKYREFLIANGIDKDLAIQNEMMYEASNLTNKVQKDLLTNSKIEWDMRNGDTKNNLAKFIAEKDVYLRDKQLEQQGKQHEDNFTIKVAELQNKGNTDSTKKVEDINKSFKSFGLGNAFNTDASGNLTLDRDNILSLISNKINHQNNTFATVDLNKSRESLAKSDIDVNEFHNNVIADRNLRDDEIAHLYNMGASGHIKLSTFGFGGTTKDEVDTLLSEYNASIKNNNVRDLKKFNGDLLTSLAYHIPNATPATVALYLGLHENPDFVNALPDNIKKDIEGFYNSKKEQDKFRQGMIDFGLGKGGNSFKPTIKENSPTNNTVSGKTKYDIALEKINKGVKLNKEASEKLYKEYQKGEITQQEYLATLTKIRNTHQSLVNSYKQLGVKP